MLAFLCVGLPALASCTGNGTEASEADTVIPDSVRRNSKVRSDATSDSITFALAGDMMLGTDFPDDSRGAFLPADSGRRLLRDCSDVFGSVDIAAGNLEGALGKGGKAKNCTNPELCYTFRMPSYMADRLAEAGIDYMNLANNHMGDFGAGGLQSSMRELKRVGIACAGVRKEAPFSIVERNGLKVGFTGFSTHSLCPSVHDYEELKRILAQMRDSCDIIVVSLHAGGEGKGYTRVPRAKETFHGWQRGDVYKFAHTAVDNGADIVWGHGPHVMRGAELYNDRLILYSLGNFCTPYKVSLSGISGQACVAEVITDREGRFAGGKLHSYLQSRGNGPRKDDSDSAAGQIKRLSELDFPESPLKISADGTLSR